MGLRQAAALVAQASDDLSDALVLIGLVLLVIFTLPFVMAWLEPRQRGSHQATIQGNRVRKT